MAELNNSSTGQWSEIDANNISASPDGWPNGTFFNQVEPIGRSTMGALKRFWDRINGTVSSIGSANAYIYTPANLSYPTAIVAGEEYSFKANFANTSAATLNINGLGAQPLYKQSSTGPVVLTGGEIQIGQIVKVQYDGAHYQIVSATASSGNMSTAVYDPAGIAQQVVGLTAAQTVTSKTFDSTNIATTQTAGDNSTKLSTTAYADAIAANSGIAKSTSGFSVTTNVTPANITNLTWALSVGTYVVDFSGYITCNTSAGFNLRGAFSGTATGKMYRAIATDTGGVIQNWPTTTTPFTSFGSTGITQISVSGQMAFVVTVAGTFSMQLAQAVSNASATAVADGQFNATVKKVA